MVTLEGVYPRSLMRLLRVTQILWMYVENAPGLYIFEEYLFANYF